MTDEKKLRDSEREELDEKWSLTSDDSVSLTRIANALKCLDDRAESGTDLIGLGEALVAIDWIIESCQVGIDVGLSFGFQFRDREFNGGL